MISAYVYKRVPAIPNLLTAWYSTSVISSRERIAQCLEEPAMRLQRDLQYLSRTRNALLSEAVWQYVSGRCGGRNHPGMAKHRFGGILFKILSIPSVDDPNRTHSCRMKDSVNVAPSSAKQICTLSYTRPVPRKSSISLEDILADWIPGHEP